MEGAEPFSGLKETPNATPIGKYRSPSVSHLDIPHGGRGAVEETTPVRTNRFMVPEDSDSDDGDSMVGAEKKDAYDGKFSGPPDPLSSVDEGAEGAFAEEGPSMREEDEWFRNHPPNTSDKLSPRQDSSSHEAKRGGLEPDQYSGLDVELRAAMPAEESVVVEGDGDLSYEQADQSAALGDADDEELLIHRERDYTPTPSRLPEQLNLNAVKLHHMKALDMDEAGPGVGMFSAAADGTFFGDDNTTMQPGAGTTGSPFQTTAERSAFDTSGGGPGLFDDRLMPVEDDAADADFSPSADAMQTPFNKHAHADRSMVREDDLGKDARDHLQPPSLPVPPVYWPPPPMRPAAYRGLERDRLGVDVGGEDEEHGDSSSSSRRKLAAKGVAWLENPSEAEGSREGGRMMEQDDYDANVEAQPAENICSPQLIPARSFRVGWGPGGMLVLPDCNPGTRRFSFKLAKVGINVSEDQRAITTALLETHKQRRKKEQREQQREQQQQQQQHEEKMISPGGGLELCRAYISTMEDVLLRNNKQHDHQHPMRYQQSVWQLVQQLWSRRTDPESYRIAALGAWIQQAVAAEVQAEKKLVHSSEETCRILLSGRQLPQAAKAAQEGENWRLAALVAQAGRCQADVRKQLAFWKKTGTLDYINKDLLRVYHILSGNIAAEAAAKLTGDADEVPICWLRALGMHLWYADSPWSEGSMPLDMPLDEKKGSLVVHVGDNGHAHSEGGSWQKSVESVVNSYLRHSTDRKSPAAPPCPPHLVAKQAAASDSREFETPRKQDLRLSLLQLYTQNQAYEGGLACLLVPEKALFSYLDYTLSWHLHEVLRRPGLGLEALHAPGGQGRNVGFERVAALVTNYAAELEAMGLWKWAVYVLMDAGRDPSLSKYVRHDYVVRQLLNRHAPYELPEGKVAVAAMGNVALEDAKHGSGGADNDASSGGDIINPFAGGEGGSGDGKLVFGGFGQTGQAAENWGSERMAVSSQESWASVRTLLHSECNVPDSWIDEALALRARSEGDSDTALEWLLRAGRWAEAHDVLMQDLVPKKFSRGLEQELEQPLRRLDVHSSHIPGWKAAGSVVLSYFNALRTGVDLSASLSACKHLMNIPVVAGTTDPSIRKNIIERNTEIKFARSEIVSTLVSVHDIQKVFGIENLMSSVNEHQRLQCLDRLSLNYLSKVKFSRNLRS